jgi:hypothetical protein
LARCKGAFIFNGEIGSRVLDVVTAAVGDAVDAAVVVGSAALVATLDDLSPSKGATGVSAFVVASRLGSPPIEAMVLPFVSGLKLSESEQTQKLGLNSLAKSVS